MSLLAGITKCPSCGTKTGARRAKCPRCRAPLASAAGPATAAAAASPAPRAKTPVAIVCIVALALTAGVAVQIGTSGDERGNPATSDTQPRTNVGAPARPAAEAESRSGIAVEPGRAGLASYNRGDIAGSLAHFTDAVAANPEDSEALNNLGQVLVRHGRASEAIVHFDKAIALDDGVWTYHFNRARAYAELKDWSRAVDGYRQAARLFPEDYATAFNLARALQAGGDLNGAIAEFQRAISLAPSEPDFHLSLAYALESAQKRDDALTAYKRYLELQDSGPAAEKVRKRVAELESTQ